MWDPGRVDGVSQRSAERPIERYVDGLAAALRGPRKVRDEMVTEARHSLQDAAASGASGIVRTMSAARPSAESAMAVMAISGMAKRLA